MNEWVKRNQDYTLIDGESQFSISFAGMAFTADDLKALRPMVALAHAEMKKIEAGEIKNPDEKRKVTHFSDRAVYADSELFAEVQALVDDVHSGAITGSSGQTFDSVVINGIGGSALGPQLMQYALNGPYWNELSSQKRGGYLKLYFLDNTDSAGFADVVAAIDPARSLHLVISKSGGTQETKNNMIAMENFYREHNLDFARHAVAITMRGSELDGYSRGKKWLKVLEMAESIGGRTSETSIVGHVPAALGGVDFAEFIAGACAMDAWTRREELCENPAYMLAASWYLAGNGKGDRNMVIVPYSDRLLLLSRYMQQLVMESIGKEFDRAGKTVHQGLNVFGNKGGTDAHAFIQQLNDGRNDFFVTFIEVLRNTSKLPIDEKLEMGDYLHGFMEGLSSALRDRKRQVISIQIPQVDARRLGMLIALYERAVAVYAEFVNINAFHQPGVQAYKLASKNILALREALCAKLGALAGFQGTALEIARKIGMENDAVEIAGLLDKASANCVKIRRDYDASKRTWTYLIN